MSGSDQQGKQEPSRLHREHHRDSHLQESEVDL